MTINSTNRKAGPYIGNGTATVFPFSFKVFQAADLEVVRLNVSTNVETTLALTTDYTVSLNQDQDSNPGGSITLVAGALASGFNLVITSDVENLQPTDLTNQGGFYPDVINDALDRATIQIQQLQEEVDRSAKLPITSAEDANALVADIVRIADSADNLDIDANNIDAINTVATNIASVNTVASDIANVNAVAANKTNIDAVNANKTNIDAVGADLLEPVSEINTVAVNIDNVNTVGNNITNVNAVAGNSTNINAVNANKTNIDAVAGNSTNINAVNANKTNIDTVATNSTAVNTVSTNIVAVNSAYTNLAAIIDAPNQAAAAANSAAQAAASAASGMYSAVQDKSANYTIVAGDAGDLIRVTTTSGAVTITLPAISAVGDGFKIAVVKWTSDANAVNIVRTGSDTINGATSAQIGSQYSQIILVADGETSTWFASQSGLGATNVNIDNFSGNGSTVNFTLSSDPSTENNTSVFISGVYQQKNTYSVSGTTLTFSTAPPAGTGNIEVAYSTPLAIGTPSDGTVTTAKIVDGAVTAAKMGSDAPLGVSDKSNSSTGYFALPSGTTAQRPGTPVNGMIRNNTTTNKMEVYQNGEWVNYVLAYDLDYLIVGGGGGGASQHAAGGGGGGFRTATAFTVTSGTSYSITVGAGGAAGTEFGTTGSGTDGLSGSNSSIGSISAVGGGGGGGFTGSAYSSSPNGKSGGSGGGGGSDTGTGGSGTSGQGNAGGNGANHGSGGGGGGGGGAGAVGANANTSASTAGNGGAGLQSNIDGNNYYYSGGGGGGAYNANTAGNGGIGGGGGGGSSIAGNASGVAGTGGGSARNSGANGTRGDAEPNGNGGAGGANTGGGGGGSSRGDNSGGNGGSGIVIIRYLGSQKGTGGTVTSSGGYTIHTFTSSGTFTA